MRELEQSELSLIEGGWMVGAPPKWMTNVAIELGKATYGFFAGFVEGNRSI